MGGARWGNPFCAPGFLLGAAAGVRLRGEVSFARVTEWVTVVDLSAYPPWLVVLATTLAVALAIWLLMKLLKLTFWLLFFGILLGGLGWAGWLLLHPPA